MTRPSRAFHRNEVTIKNTVIGGYILRGNSENILHGHPAHMQSLGLPRGVQSRSRRLFLITEKIYMKPFSVLFKHSLFTLLALCNR